MAKTAEYWQKGETIDYRNMTDEKIAANTVVSIGSRIGIAGTEINPGELGTLHMVGVFIIPKKAGVALNAGDEVTFTEADGIDKAVDAAVGYAIEAADTAAATVKVKLLG